MIRCDIIIPVWNQLDYTRECVENLIRNTRPPYRLILIDNGSKGPTRSYLKEVARRKGVEIQLVTNDRNLGFVKAANQGLRLSDAPYVVILNNDTIPAKGWLERMIDFAENHKDVGLVNPQCDGHIATPIDTYAGMLAKRKGEYMEMNQCQGFCMLIKRDVIERIGLLDEDFEIGGFDDTDYSMRAHLADFRCVAVKDAYVYHRLHGTFRATGDRDRWVERNERIYYAKWGKHLRIGIPLNINAPHDERLRNAVLFAYGLAREWAWVHLWVNLRRDHGAAKKVVAETLKKYELPPHQNIRIEYFALPPALFLFAVGWKFLERLRKRMRSKRFDAVMVPDTATTSYIRPFATVSRARVIDVSFRSDTDWVKKGRSIALFIKTDEKRSLRHNNTGL